MQNKTHVFPRGIVFFALLATVFTLSVGCTKCSQNKQTAAPAATGGPLPGLPPMKEEEIKELRIVDQTPGSGAVAEPGKAVTVHYSGYLFNGTKFDSSVDRGQPFTFQLGAGQVIQGWELGVQGLKVGGKRFLVIPSSLAYGERGAGNVIPPNAALIFDIELIDVK